MRAKDFIVEKTQGKISKELNKHLEESMFILTEKKQIVIIHNTD